MACTARSACIRSVCIQGALSPPRCAIPISPPMRAPLAAMGRRLKKRPSFSPRTNARSLPACLRSCMSKSIPTRSRRRRPCPRSARRRRRRQSTLRPRPEGPRQRAISKDGQVARTPASAGPSLETSRFARLLRMRSLKSAPPPSLVSHLAAADLAARDFSVGRGGEAVRRKSDDEDREPEDENGARENEHSHVRDLLVLDKADKVTGQSRDADIEQEPHRHVIGAKINSDHRADLEIDEQKQQILDRGAAFLDHGVERRGGRPDGSRPDCEERENVEAVGQQSAERIDERQHPLVEGLGGILLVCHCAAPPSRALRTFLPFGAEKGAIILCGQTTVRQRTTLALERQ